MPAPVSVILPTLNAAPDLGPVLADLTLGVQAGLVHEVIFADGGSTDETAEIAEAVGAVFVSSEKGRGVQLAAGCAAARGAYLFVVHTDSRLPPDWPERIKQVLEHGPGPAYYGRLRFAAKGIAPRIVERWAELRSHVFGLPYGDQGLLVPRTLYAQRGGYQEIPLMEDVALARALRGALKPLDLTVTTSATRYENEGWVRRGLGNLILLCRYMFGASPEKLAEQYRAKQS
ncbi:MAG: TIGR04283 family arsenosugar biosynthesis glycosyltransferase [Pseudomonadota bacterium]